MKKEVVVYWFRRDLRLKDNRALFEALKSGYAVLPIFIFDTDILNKLQNKDDRRVQFIHDCLTDIHKELNVIGSGVLVKQGKPELIWKQLLKDYDIKGIYLNNDYEPYARERDAAVELMAEKATIAFHSYKDQVIFEKNEIIKDDGTPYTIFTPYSKKWKSHFTKDQLTAFNSKKLNYIKERHPLPAMQEIGFNKTKNSWPPKTIKQSTLVNYKSNRDFPALNATSKLSMHLRFGTISIRKAFEYTLKYSETWMNELIWREFYKMILWHFPHVENSVFKKKYEGIKWNNNEKEFEAWCRGKTGYPLVDAGMRELNETGFMHNRVRMVVASFLTKHLLIDWRWGEAYFAEKLLDFDLSANNGGWQWSAGTGSDSAPYFRIFNPESQMKKFDKDLEYIKRWVPEYGTDKYLQPIVDHQFARERCLKAYKVALN